MSGAVISLIGLRAAIVAPKAFGALLRAIATYEGARGTVAAIELLALTFVRPGELRSAEWPETQRPAPISSAASQKAKPNAKRSAASNATSPDKSGTSSTTTNPPLRHHLNHQDNESQPVLQD